MPRPARHRTTPGRVVRPLLTLLGCTALLAGCGSPPEPLPTAPPAPRETLSMPASGQPYPGGTGPGGPGLGGSGLAGDGLPPLSLPPGVLPTLTNQPYTPPAYTPPAYTPPAYTPPRTTAPAPTPTRSLPPPAPACSNGRPSRAQMIAAVQGTPGMPSRPVEVRSGPFCAGSWQFAILGIVGTDDDEEEPLLMVTTGQPTALQLVSAGTDVCTDRVAADAPPGIRVRACGA